MDMTPEMEQAALDGLAANPFAKVYAEGYDAGAKSTATAPPFGTQSAERDYPILRYFEFAHLPERLQLISAPFAELAYRMVNRVEHTAEVEAGLRKLLEAKDCFVRAALDQQ